MRSFKTHNDPGANIEVNGTSLSGYISCTRNQLQQMFGEPMYNGPGDKVTTEWLIKFDDGMVVTIYDWKRYDNGPGLNEVYQWHIGSHQQWRSNAVARIHDCLREHVGLTARSEAWGKVA